MTYEEIALSVLAGLIKARRLEDSAAAPSPAATATAAACCGSDSTVGVAPVAASEEGSAATKSAVDPVCGMRVDRASAEFMSEYQGNSYYFCCAGCQHSFDKSPEEYVRAREDA